MSTHYWGPDAVDQVLITKPSVSLVDDSQADKYLNPFQSLQLPSQWSSLSAYIPGYGSYIQIFPAVIRALHFPDIFGCYYELRVRKNILE